jgi:hypothetical protein
MRYENHKGKLFASAKEIACGKAETILEFIKGAIITSADLRERIFKKLFKVGTDSICICN